MRVCRCGSGARDLSVRRYEDMLGLDSDLVDHLALVDITQMNIHHVIQLVLAVVFIIVVGEFDDHHVTGRRRWRHLNDRTLWNRLAAKETCKTWTTTTTCISTAPH